MKPSDMKTFEAQWVQMCTDFEIEEYYLVFLVKEGDRIHTVTLGNVDENARGLPAKRLNVLVRGVIGGLYDLTKKYLGFSRHTVSGMLKGLAEEFTAPPDRPTVRPTLNDQAD